MKITLLMHTGAMMIPGDTALWIARHTINNFDKFWGLFVNMWLQPLVWQKEYNIGVLSFNRLSGNILPAPVWLYLVWQAKPT